MLYDYWSHMHVVLPESRQAARNCDLITWEIVGALEFTDNVLAGGTQDSF